MIIFDVHTTIKSLSVVGVVEIDTNILKDVKDILDGLNVKYNVNTHLNITTIKLEKESV